MDISDRNRELLVSEIAYVRRRMAEAKSPERKVYYYSAIYGMIDRTMRQEYDKQLVFAHFVINSTYNVIFSQMQSIKGGLVPIELDPDFFTKLDVELASLQSHMENKQDDDIYIDLESIVALAWSITGGGFYDKEKFDLP